MRALIIAVALVLLAGCTDTVTPGVAPASSPPALGGTVGPSGQPPGAPMSPAEDTIVRRLSEELRRQRLTLDYLDCPHLARRVPQTLLCAAYIEGVLADVRVRLTGSAHDLRFAATLGKGIVATSNLARRLATEGYSGVDCGERSAYPTVVGSEIFCSVTRNGEQKYVVATITTEGGKVEIRDY